MLRGEASFHMKVLPCTLLTGSAQAARQAGGTRLVSVLPGEGNEHLNHPLQMNAPGPCLDLCQVSNYSSVPPDPRPEFDQI